MRKSRGISKFYMFIVPFLPVLAQYSLFDGRLDLDVVAMLVAAVLFLTLKRKSHVRYPRLTLFLILYIFVITIINLLVNNMFAPTTIVIMRAGRYCVYLFIVLVVAMDEVDYATIMRLYRHIVYAAAIYIALQTCLYYGMNIVLPNRIGEQSSNAVGSVGRLHAFYSEPADMAYSVVPFVVCSLFGPQYLPYKDTRFRDAVFATAAVLLSTSSQGTVCIIFVWTMWIFVSIISKSVSTKRVLALIAVIAVVVLMEQFNILNYSLGRLDAGLDSNAWEARRGGYTTLNLLSPMQKIFGVGYGNYLTEKVVGLDTYGEYINYSSIAEILFTLGYVGTGIIAILLINAFHNGYKYQKVLIITMLFFSIGGCPFTGKYMPLYFCLIMLGKFDSREHSREETKKLFA